MDSLSDWQPTAQARRTPSLPFVLLVVIIAIVANAPSLCAQFRDATAEYGFDGGGCVAFADFDNDGFVDAYNGKLWHNQSGKRFTAVDAGLPGGAGVWADCNNDGWVDLFIFSGEGSLWLNSGGGKPFTRVDFPKLPTVNSLGAVWFDANNDSWPDLYVGGYEIWQQAVHPDVLLLNAGRKGAASTSGSKVEISFEESWRSPPDKLYSTRGVTAADLNEDGNVDIYTSNYRLQPNQLLLSNGKGQLRNSASAHKAAGIPDGGRIRYTGGLAYEICGHTIGSALGDLDHDGHIDIFVGNFSHPQPHQDRPQFLRNTGPKGKFHFEDKSAEAGLAWQESYASAALGDYNNDGRLDLYFTTVYGVGSGNIKNFPVLYKNVGTWKFQDVTESQKLQQLPSTYQAAWADIDNDGDLDLCTAGKLFVNERPATSHWIQLRLHGDGQRVNRSAIGAVARISAGQHTLCRHVETGTGQGNQNDPRLHFALPKDVSSVNIDITWPGGSIQKVENLTLGKIHDIKFQGIDSKDASDASDASGAAAPQK